MPVKNDMGEILKLISIQSPFIVPLVVIFSSFVKEGGENDGNYFKVLFYLFGGLLLAVSWAFLANLINVKHNNPQHKSLVCNTFSIFSTPFYVVPAWNTFFLSYTFFYLLIPMIKNNQPRIIVMLLFGFFILLDAFMRWKVFNCYGDNFGTACCAIFAGIAFAFIFTYIWFYFVNSINNGDYVFFSKRDSNRLKCSKKSKKQMKCTVYKNGLQTGIKVI